MAPGYTNFPFPKDLMSRFVQQNNGKADRLYAASMYHEQHSRLSLLYSLCMPLYWSECILDMQVTFQSKWKLFLRAHVYMRIAQSFRQVVQANFTSDP